MKVTIYGAGYVGLVTGACLSEVGNDVLCVDVNEDRVAALNRGEIPIYEPGLSKIIIRNCESGRLRFTTHAAEAVAHGILQFVAVGTPPAEDGSADLKYVLEVAQTIGRHMEEYRLVVDKSTVPVGTADRVSKVIAEELKKRSEDIPYSVASNPEFLKEGDAVTDFMKPDRIVIGTGEARAEQLLRELYAPFNRNHERVFAMDVRSAELTKYAANAMLATKISFMNEMANIAECVGANIEQVRLGIGSDSRIGYSFIYPGCGYGGSCFPKDVRAVEQTSRAHGYEPRILPAVDATNEAQKEVLFSKIQYRLGNLKGKTIAIWGLAFKPNTDDMREASSLVLIRALLDAGAKVRAHDPESMKTAESMLPGGVEYCDDPYTAIEGANALAIVTEWKAFRSPGFERVKELLTEPLIFDGRNLYDPEAVAAAGMEYHSIGRSVSMAKA
ncbi:MAG: UDP-glucose/GDP-mannose dehydrogenase family protein [Verrucomicrobiota bacterium]|jgi:UDPglucose 6-dehydrogenase|nr:UDP-glucose/GDP-mannose dehydrogenase family protein [Verrucomicrobiota bacterium]